MTVTVANTLISNTWDFWRSRTNQMADVMTNQCVTVQGNAAVGIAEIIGALRANTVYVDTLTGGRLGNTGMITVSTNITHTQNNFVSLNLFVGQNTYSNVVQSNTMIAGVSVTVGNTVINRANTYSDAFYGRWLGNTIEVNKGGTGINIIPTAGQLLIGTGTGYALAGLSSSDGITVTNANGSITINNSGVLRFRSTTSGAWRNGNITLDSSDVINALGFVPAVSNTDSWTRAGTDLNYFTGNVAVGYTDSVARASGKMMLRSTSNVYGQPVLFLENANAASSNATSYIQTYVANTGANQGIRFAKAAGITAAIDYLTSSDTLALTTGGVPRLYVDTTGNIGFGISAPQPNNGGNGLHIVGTNPGMTIDNGGGLKWHIGQNYNSTTIVGGVRQAGQFAIFSDQAQAGLIFTGNSNTASLVTMVGGQVRMNVRPDGIVQIGTTGTQGRLNVGGDINTEGSFTNYSDYRLKDTVLPLTDSIDRIMALRPVSFKFSKDNRKEEGFIAHEVQAVVPTAVKGVKDGVVYQTLDKSQILPVTVQALQDLINIVKQQQQQIDELKNR